MAKNSLVQSVVRALDILDMVAGAEDGLTLQGIAGRLEVPPPTAYNLARTLLTRGYLEKTAHPARYRLGPALLDILRWRSERALLQRAGDELRTLSATFPQATLVFCEHVGGEISAVLRISAERPSVLQRNYQHAMAPYASVSSLVFLALWSEAEREQYRARHPFEEFGVRVWRDRAALDAFLTEVRRAGYACLPVSETSGSLRIAAPVFAPEGPLVASVGLLLPCDRQTSADSGRLIELLTTAAKRLSTAEDARETHEEAG